MNNLTTKYLDLPLSRLLDLELLSLDRRLFDLCSSLSRGVLDILLLSREDGLRDLFELRSRERVLQIQKMKSLVIYRSDIYIHTRRNV